MAQAAGLTWHMHPNSTKSLDEELAEQNSGSEHRRRSGQPSLELLHSGIKASCFQGCGKLYGAKSKANYHFFLNAVFKFSKKGLRWKEVEVEITEPGCSQQPKQ
jgi:hypothetical protein